MGLEIERKFLVKDNSWKEQVSKAIEIKQGYLNSNHERTVRVRILGKKGIITIKGKTVSFTRLEYEYEIPLEDAQELIKLCEKPIIEKTRYYLPQNNSLWEIDVFAGENEGLILAEIELESEDEKVELPSWVDKEVTSEIKYYNSNLIKMPFKKWH